jgi:hypothetical protein
MASLTPSCGSIHRTGARGATPSVSWYRSHTLRSCSASSPFGPSGCGQPACQRAGTSGQRSRRRAPSSGTASPPADRGR